MGEGVDRTRTLTTEGIDRTLAAVRDYAALARDADVVFGIGTSVLRDASNKQKFFDGFSSVTGVALDVLSGEEEALSSFEGALCGLRAADMDVPAGVSVVDVGGGSTEIATRAGAAQMPAVHSLQLGAVRLTEASLNGDPPAPADVERSRHAVQAELKALPSAVRPQGAIVAVGGTASTAARMLQALDETGSSGIAVLAAQDVSTLLRATLAMPIRERLRLRGLPAQRADIFPAGLMIIDEIVRAAGADRLTVSESDLLLGYIARHT